MSRAIARPTGPTHKHLGEQMRVACIKVTEYVGVGLRRGIAAGSLGAGRLQVQIEMPSTSLRGLSRR
jgi:hypothetical protein